MRSAYVVAAATPRSRTQVSGRWGGGAACLCIAVAWLSLLHLTAASARGKTVEFSAGAPQQSVGPPVQLGVVGRDKPVDGVSVFDVAIIDTAWEGKDLEFALRNQTAQSVTAWEVMFELLYPDGSTERTAVSVDGYAEYEGLRRGNERPVVIPASGEVRTRVRLPGWPRHPAPIVPPKAAVIGVVFADLTAAGHAIFLSRVFDSRRQICDGWAAVIAALEPATVRDTPGSALAELDAVEADRFPRSAATIDPYADARFAMTKVRAQLRGAKNRAERVPPKETVHSALVEARKELAAAQRHSRPQE
jgi:hypothetical protein